MVEERLAGYVHGGQCVKVHMMAINISHHPYPYKQIAKQVAAYVHGD